MTSPGLGPFASRAGARHGQRHRRGCGRRHGRCRCSHLDMHRLDPADHADTQVTLLHFDFGQIRLGHEFGEFANELGIERFVLRHRHLGHSGQS